MTASELNQAYACACGAASVCCVHLHSSRTRQEFNRRRRPRHACLSKGKGVRPRRRRRSRSEGPPPPRGNASLDAHGVSELPERRVGRSEGFTGAIESGVEFEPSAPFGFAPPAARSASQRGGRPSDIRRAAAIGSSVTGTESSRASNLWLTLRDGSAGCVVHLGMSASRCMPAVRCPTRTTLPAIARCSTMAPPLSVVDQPQLLVLRCSPTCVTVADGTDACDTCLSASELATTRPEVLRGRDVVLCCGASTLRSNASCYGPDECVAGHRETYYDRRDAVAHGRDHGARPASS